MSDYSQLAQIIASEYAPEDNLYYQMGANTLKQKAPELDPNGNRSFWGGFLPAATQGFMGGTAMGYGKKSALMDRQELSDKIAAAPALGSNEFADYVKGDKELSKLPQLGLLNAARMSELEDNESKIQGAIALKQAEKLAEWGDEVELVKDEKGRIVGARKKGGDPIAVSAEDKYENSSNLSLESIKERYPGISKARAEQLLQAEREEELRRTRPLSVQDIPSAMVGEYQKRYEFNQEARDIARELRAIGPSWSNIQASKMFSGMDDEGIGLSIKNLADKLARARSGAALNKSEEALYQQLVGGDITAGPERISFLLNKLADTDSRMAANSLKFMKKSGGTLDGMIGAFEEGGNPTQALEDYQISLDSKTGAISGSSGSRYAVGGKGPGGKTVTSVVRIK